MLHKWVVSVFLKPRRCFSVKLIKRSNVIKLYCKLQVARSITINPRSSVKSRNLSIFNYMNNWLFLHYAIYLILRSKIHTGILLTWGRGEEGVYENNSIGMGKFIFTCYTTDRKVFFNIIQEWHIATCKEQSNKFNAAFIIRSARARFLSFPFSTTFLSTLLLCWQIYFTECSCISVVRWIKV